ncbi:MAG TPA: hypothetical protein VJB92_01245 [Candidatus Paceibacterota bacterium]
MYIPDWVLIIIFAAIIWLLAMTSRLHKRIKGLKRMIRRLEGQEEEEKPELEGGNGEG